MKEGFARFSCLLILFSICFAVGSLLNYYLGCAIAGFGFGVAYCFGEGRERS